MDLIKATRGTPIIWADTDDFTGTVSGLTRTEQIDLTGIAAGAARQGAKHDFGATQFMDFLIGCAFEFVSGAADGDIVDVYHVSSPSGTAANANPGETSGVDAAYTGTTGSSIANSVLQLTRLGAFNVTADNTTKVQYQVIGRLSWTEMLRYGMPVAVNNASGAFMTDAVEMYIGYFPIDPDIQA